MHANEKLIKPEIHFADMTYTARIYIAPYHFTNSGPKVRSFTCYEETSILVLYGIYDHELKKDSVLKSVFDISI